MSKKNIRNHMICLLSFVAVFAILLFVSNPSMATGNKEKNSATNQNSKVDMKEEESLPELTFSADSGFYEKEFSLAIDVPEGSKVYYTLDSSIPSQASTPYTGEITITDPSSKPNVLCNNPDFWPYRVLPAIEGEPEVVPDYYARYERTLSPIDKCTVVRAIAVDEAGNVSPVKTASYFVGFQSKTGYENISVLSIVSDPDGLFGDEKGIMVNGKEYRSKLLKGDFEGIDDTHLLRDYTNAYTGRGREWEREAHLDYFKEGGSQLLFSQEAGIRLHGNQSRIAVPQKSFNLYARKDYGDSVFGCDFFGDGLLSDTVTLMRSNDIRNYYLSQKLNHRAMDTQNYHMVQVFLDGEYWGMYAIQDRYNSDRYMKEHYGLSKEDYKLYSGKPEGFEMKNGMEKTTLTSFRLLKNYVAQADLSDPAEYKKVASMMDIPSFINFYAARVYMGDEDWNWYKNSFLIYYDDKWHWILYDVDYGVGGHDECKVENNTFTSHRLVPEHSLANDPLFSYLMRNEEFRKEFANTFMDLINDVFVPSKVQEDKDAFLTTYGSAIAKTLQRYPAVQRMTMSQGMNFYQEQWGIIVDYFQRRPAYAINYMKDYMKLTGSLVEVNLQVNDSAGGTIQINTITPELKPENGWTGKYFTDCPVTVVAKPAIGWEFVEWKCDSGTPADAKNSKTQISFSKDTVITAVFKKKTVKNKKSKIVDV